jgi:hypothetical protein
MSTMLRTSLQREWVHVHGLVSVHHVCTRHGQLITSPEGLTPKQRRTLESLGFRPEALFTNLIVNAGRAHLAKLLRGVVSTYINRVQLGDTKIGGVVRKSDYPPDLSDTRLVHEITNLAGQPAATFDLDDDSSPDEVIKVSALTGTPGTLTTSALIDAGQDFVSEGVNARDTVTVVIGGEDYTLGIVAVTSATELEVANPNQLAGAVGYSVQTPGTQALFRKLLSGDDFPESSFGTTTVIHEAGLLYADGTLFNRVTFYQQDDGQGLALQPTDIDGSRIDVQLDWLITF